MKIVNKLILLIIFFLAISCDKQIIKEICVLYVDPDIETPIRIDEKSFDFFFRNDMDSFVIKNVNTISKIEFELNQLKYANLDSFPKPDIRIKLIVRNTNNKNDTIYMDKFVIQFKNKLFVLSPSLESIIYKQIREN
jgi:hypothetical protein